MSAFKDWLNGLTSKSTPVDADELYVRDSSGTPSSKKLTWANIKATLKTYFDSLYLAVTGGTITDTTSAVGGASAGSALTVNQTWNTTGTPTAIKLNVTDTASNAASRLMDLQVGGVSKFTIHKTASLGIYAVGLGDTAGNRTLITNNQGLAIVQGGRFGWGGAYGGDTGAGGAADLELYRDAANTLAQRNGTNAQTFRLYNTYTDASNYERGFMRWNSNVLEIGAEKAGTGTSRAVKFIGQSGTSVGLTQYTFDVNIGGSVNRSFLVTSGIAAFPSGHLVGWANGSSATNPDTTLVRAEAGVIGFRAANSSTGAAAEFLEMTAPAAPAANSVRIYAEDDGAGKTRLMALFATGAAVQIAIEP